ncbi:SDR family NAD(P)-dependent oxidoreductase [Streptomyces sp. 5-10]|uniref:SDR family NAD(P)-dependent oxidoreductase n=1 Tax=Streptomyces sp. 5-10 TaxID=878925 RepID=UPI00168B31C3|nr:SDR family oxidoreductase [Streptomyces sp. 5-10]MBD3004849.1 SDR family oxidoreductase [Streptomyces sp. 5-10]
MTAHDVGDPFRLDGARALVTGASRGIGAAIARALADAGADLALGARTEQALEATARHVLSTGHQAHAVPADFIDASAAGDSVNRAADALGGLDIVVHAAGILPTYADGTPKIAPLDQLSLGECNQVMTVNTNATMAVCQQARPHLASGRHPSLTLVSSVAGIIGVPGMDSCGVTKAAQLSLVRTLAVGWARQGIRVNALTPGWVKTDMTAFAVNATSLSDWLMAHVPQGCWLEPEDVAHSAVFLASRAAACITGHSLVIDGALSIADGGLAGIPKPDSPFIQAGAR